MVAVKSKKKKQLYLILLICLELIVISYFSFSFLSLLNPPNECNSCNVLIITMDSLRADHVGSYGYSRNTTPNIDKLAEKGVLFQNFIASGPLTFISLPSLMSSKYPVLTKANVSFEKDEDTHLFYLNESHVTLADQLTGRNYKTAAFTVTGWTKYTNMDKGFQLKNNLLDKGPYEDVIAREEAISFINDSMDDKFFVWVHFQSPHTPYTPLYQYNETFYKDNNYRKYGLIDIPNNKLPHFLVNNEPGGYYTVDADYFVSQYDGEIRFIDNEIGKIIEFLENHDLMKNTIIAISSDHGESFAEHGLYFQHEYLYDDQLKIPLVLYNPKFPSQKKIAKQVQGVDLYPTIMEFLNLPYKKEELDGKSFNNLIAQKPYEERIAYSESIDYNSFSLRTNDWKYIFNSNGSQEIYDLVKDPEEEENLLIRKKDAMNLLDNKFRREIKRYMN